MAAGCQTNSHSKKDEPLASLMVHLEASPYAADPTEEAHIMRTDPVTVIVQKEPFLTEADLADAKLVDTVGGFSLQLQLRQHGTWILEETSTDNQGKRAVIFSQFGTATNKIQRWLGVFKMVRRVSTGVITFTPDTSREEAELLVSGLTNMVHEVSKKEHE